MNSNILKRTFCSQSPFINFKNNIDSTIKGLRCVNLREYYTRRYEYDYQKNKFTNFSEEELNQEAEKMNSIKTVQNMYFVSESIIDSEKSSS
mmetsp:Transcript_9474/g.9804  ORF Transcript_9474/g.9804 Transcript_9474/m.9804 type:complete len:92 (+) Transcript_9474:12-287(+)